MSTFKKTNIIRNINKSVVFLVFINKSKIKYFHRNEIKNFV